MQQLGVYKKGKQMRKRRKISFLLMFSGWSIYLFFSFIHSNRTLFLTGWLIAVAGIVFYIWDFVEVIKSRRR